MGSRRRNLFILAFVLGLTLASLAVINAKDTKLGLDLSGGTELIYQGRPTPQNPEIEGEDMDRSIEIIRERTDTLGVSEPEISRLGTDSVRVGLPDVQNAERAIAQVGDTAQLFFYDWEPNVISTPEDASPSSDAETPFQRLYDAVQFASEQEPECFEDTCTTTGPTFYLFDSQTLELIAGPGATKSDLFVDQPDEKQPPRSEIIAVPQGTIVVREEAPPDNPDTPENESDDDEGLGCYVLRDRPALSGDDIRNPEQQQDPNTNQPNVAFEFNDAGREAFSNVTREIAERGLNEAPPGTSPADAANFSDHFAVVLDDEVVSRPIINFAENPQGIDGRTGAQIEGSFSIQEAQDLAEFLKIGALPIELKLISQSTVSATLGEEALDQGLKAGLAGLALVILFLIAYYRFLGVVAALGLLLYGDLLLRAGRADPDHADAARHRGTDPDDRRRGRLQRRHLRANKGGGQSGQIHALCDRHRLSQGHRDDHRRERDRADHGLHPVRALDGRGQGLRLHAGRRHDRLAVHGGRLHPGLPGPVRARGVHALAGLPRRDRGAGALALRLHRA